MAGGQKEDPLALAVFGSDLMPREGVKGYRVYAMGSSEGTCSRIRGLGDVGEVGLD